MTMQNYFILTGAQRSTVIGYNTPSAEIDPRAVDNASPGAGLNLNDNATGVALGEAVTLTGTYVAPKRVVDDPTYPSNMKAYLLALPWASLENETIFAPQD